MKTYSQHEVNLDIESVEGKVIDIQNLNEGLKSPEFVMLYSDWAQTEAVESTEYESTIAKIVNYLSDAVIPHNVRIPPEHDYCIIYGDPMIDDPVVFTTNDLSQFEDARLEALGKDSDHMWVTIIIEGHPIMNLERNVSYH